MQPRLVALRAGFPQKAPPRATVTQIGRAKLKKNHKITALCTINLIVLKVLMPPAPTKLAVCDQDAIYRNIFSVTKMRVLSLPNAAYNHKMIDSGEILYSQTILSSI